VPLEDALFQVLTAFDEGQSLEKLPIPSVRAKDRPSRDWLLACLREERLSNPFPKGGKAHREAETLRAFLTAAPAEQLARFQALPLTQAGTQVALWRWGQSRTRRGELAPPLRGAWEDLLLKKGRALVVRGWTLRHAFCFALAEADENRLATLMEGFSEELPELTQQFQRAFALLGGPSPRFYLWSLPDLESMDLSLARLGPHIHIAPLEPGTPPASPEAAWIIPCIETNFPAKASILEGKSLEEANRIAEQTRALGRKAYLAPSREPFEAYSLVFFPIDIRLDPAGMIRSIRMGDAALAQDSR
jgi:hypothetical protein